MFKFFVLLLLDESTGGRETSESMAGPEIEKRVADDGALSVGDGR